MKSVCNLKFQHEKAPFNFLIRVNPPAEALVDPCHPGKEGMCIV